MMPYRAGGIGAILGVRGLTLCRRRSPATRRAPHNVIPGTPGTRDEVCSPGAEAGRRRPIGGVAALPIHHPRDPADGTTLGPGATRRSGPQKAGDPETKFGIGIGTGIGSELVTGAANDLSDTPFVLPRH
jgi:hypothetical protein